MITHIYGICESPEAMVARKPNLIEFHVQTDAGDVKILYRPATPAGLTGVVRLVEEVPS